MFLVTKLFNMVTFSQGMIDFVAFPRIVTLAFEGLWLCQDVWTKDFVYLMFLN